MLPGAVQRTPQLGPMVLIRRQDVRRYQPHVVGRTQRRQRTGRIRPAQVRIVESTRRHHAIRVMESEVSLFLALLKEYSFFIRLPPNITGCGRLNLFLKIPSIFRDAIYTIPHSELFWF